MKKPASFVSVYVCVRHYIIIRTDDCQRHEPIIPFCWWLAIILKQWHCNEPISFMISFILSLKPPSTQRIT